VSGWLDADRPGSGHAEGDLLTNERGAFVYRDGEWRPLQVGDRLPMPARKPDIRPAFTGAGAPSFKPARKAKRL
jgi:hypothetical protein